MKKFHDTPVKTRQFLVELLDLATDEQKEQVVWSIARGDFPIGFEKVDNEEMTIFMETKM